MKRKLLIYTGIIIIAVTVLVPEALSGAQEEFHRTYTVDEGTGVEVSNINGKVYITTWDNDYVDVHAVKRTKKDQEELDKVSIEVNTNGTMEIKTVRDKSQEEESFLTRIFGKFGGNYPKVTVDFTIKLPESVILTAARTINGTVELDETRGDTITSATNGKIVVDNTDGYIEAKTVNGNIDITGKVTIREAKTINGSIKASLSGEGTEDTHISTTNGSVDLYLSTEINANLELKTVNGNISAKGFRLMLDTISRKQIIGTLGSGGRTISVKTVNGSITLNEE